MARSPTDRLCTKCALCCDGSLFADVELAGKTEVTRLEAMGLEVDDDDGGLLELPCGALRGKKCGIYEHRPSCCRTFECRLLQDFRRGTLGPGQATTIVSETLERIGRLRRLATRLGADEQRGSLREHCLEALSVPDPDRRPSGRSRMRAELELLLDDLDEILRERFLRSDPSIDGR